VEKVEKREPDSYKFLSNLLDRIFSFLSFIPHLFNYKKAIFSSRDNDSDVAILTRFFLPLSILLSQKKNP
jgi:hypothetical protein